MATEATYKKLISLEGAKNLIFFGALGRAPFQCYKSVWLSLEIIKQVHML
jgi:hypothetical protein